MKLINPQEIRQLYAELGWLTLTEIAGGTKVAITTVSNALDGKPVRPSTARALAEPLGKKVTEIAVFAN